MWHKVNPLAFRIWYIKTWKTSGYFWKKDYTQKVSDDTKIRSFIEKTLVWIPVGNIFINYSNDFINIVIYTSKVSLILWKNWENITKLEEDLKKKFNLKFWVDVKEIKKPELSAPLVADSIARQVEKKLPYRRVIKNIVAKTMEKWWLWIKVIASWRLNGVDIARTETYKEWAIPTQTLRADIEFALDEAKTIYWIIGIKVWIYKGEVFKNKKQ